MIAGNPLWKIPGVSRLLVVPKNPTSPDTVLRVNPNCQAKE